MRSNLTYIFLYGNWSPHNGYRKTKSEKKTYKIIKLNVNTVPKIILVGAHTSNNLFLRPLTTQWYWNFSTVEQFCVDAILPQFFLRAAASHSVLEVGQESTTLTLSTASWQYLFWLVHHCCRKLIEILSWKNISPNISLI